MRETVTVRKTMTLRETVKVTVTVTVRDRDRNIRRAVDWVHKSAVCQVD